MPTLHSSNTHHKRNLAVKRQDGEPLTRADLQYDLLEAIFADKHAVFTDPHTTIRGDPAGTKVTFRDLYVNALIHSPRCSKMSRDKIRELPLYGNEFAMISLLSNVGRINTTMACELPPPSSSALNHPASPRAREPHYTRFAARPPPTTLAPCAPRSR